MISLNNNLTIPISTVTLKFPMHSNVVEYSKKKIVQNEFAFFNALEWRKLLMMRFNELVKRTKPHTRIIRNSRQLQFQFTRLNWKLKSICNEKNPVLMLVMYSKKKFGNGLKRRANYLTHSIGIQCTEFSTKTFIQTQPMRIFCFVSSFSCLAANLSSSRVINDSFWV